MRMPDVNVLVYAHRRDEAFHDPYRDWLEALVRSDEPFALSPLVAGGFLRIVTHRRIYTEPTPLAQALATIETLATRSNCRVVGPGPRHLELVAGACRAARATGKLVADACHAAVAIEGGCEWVTRDGDFARFEGCGLRWRHLVL